MGNTLPRGLQDTLLWSEELGQGFHTRPAIDYDGGYFQNYRRLDATPMGAALTRARIDLVRKHVEPASVLDIGIGGGRFVEDADCFGFDVCPDARQWLLGVKRFRNPSYGWDNVSCWDSLEHIPEPELFVSYIKKWLFVSMPIYEGLQHVLTSKHYKPGEHLHYWTLQGFISWCARQGFECMEINSIETDLGREGITSFAFKRVRP